MNPPQPTPRPGTPPKDADPSDADPLFDPEDDSDLGIDDAASEDVGLDVRAGLDDLEPEDFVEDGGAAEAVRWTDGNEAAGDAIGDDDRDDGQSEYGWTQDNEPATDLEADVDGLQELAPEQDDHGAEGIEDEEALLDADFGQLPPLRAEEEHPPADADAEVMSEFAALTGADAMADDEGVVVAPGVGWGRHTLGVVRIDSPIRLPAGGGDAGRPAAVAGQTLWLHTPAGLRRLEAGQLHAFGWDGLPAQPDEIALPAGAHLATDGGRQALVRAGDALHGARGEGGEGGFGPLPPLPPSVEHDGPPLLAVVAQPATRRLAAWPGHGLHASEAGGVWRPKPSIAGVLQLASDGQRHVAALGDAGLSMSADGGDSFGAPIDPHLGNPKLGEVDGLWVCRDFAVLRGPGGLVGCGPHGTTRLLDLRPEAVAVVWEASLPVVYCAVRKHDGGGVIARVELRRTRTPARIVFEVDELHADVALTAQREGQVTRLCLLTGGQLFGAQLSAGADDEP